MTDRDVTRDENCFKSNTPSGEDCFSKGGSRPLFNTNIVAVTLRPKTSLNLFGV